MQCFESIGKFKELWINALTPGFNDCNKKSHYELFSLLSKEELFWANCYNIFYVLNLQMFEISSSVCPWQAFHPSKIYVGKAKCLP